MTTLTPERIEEIAKRAREFRFANGGIDEEVIALNLFRDCADLLSAYDALSRMREALVKARAIVAENVGDRGIGELLAEIDAALSPDAPRQNKPESGTPDEGATSLCGPEQSDIRGNSNAQMRPFQVLLHDQYYAPHSTPQRKQVRHENPGAQFPGGKGLHQSQMSAVHDENRREKH